MKLYVGITDSGWYDFLSRSPRDEVNFWSPGGTTTFKVLQRNELFLFKLHSPKNFIVGGGYFVSHTKLPLSLAWEAFGINNGAQNINSFHNWISKFRKTAEADPIIGCNVLASPFFWPRRDWIPTPPSFALSIVQGKSYTTDGGDGAALFEQVMQRLQNRPVLPGFQTSVVAEGGLYGKPYLTRPRLGQGGFRVLVTDAYERRCALTGERTLPVLDAAHIRPYSQNGPHDPQNGLLMRSDLHKLFDKGYLTVRPDLTIDISPRIQSEFSNGRVYYALQDHPLAVTPARVEDRPSFEYLDWHNRHIFRR